MSSVLGVSCFYHDAAAALLVDGRPVAAAEEERFTRIKHDSGFPSHAIAFCLAEAGLDSRDLDRVVFYEKPLVKFERTLQTMLATFPRSWRAFGEGMITWFDRKLWIKSILEHELGIPGDRILFCDHHTAHAASAFLASPFQEAALLTVDGVGEWTTTATGVGRADWGDGGGTRIELNRELRFPHSLGLLYSTFTAWLGFRVNNGEYKVMGMAPYGEPRYTDRVGELIEVAGDGSFRLNTEYFAFHHSTTRPFGRRFVELFGPPRPAESPFVTPGSHPGADPEDPAVERSRYYADVAASLQRVTEDVLLKMARHLHRETGLEDLCMAGGVALNSVANGRIHRETPFRRVFVQPAAGDAGGALGAALWAWHQILGRPRAWVMEDAYLGKEWGAGEIRKVLDDRGASYVEIGQEDELVRRVVDALARGQVVALHQGRFEWGPRALGNRSILADPRSPDTKDRINAMVKFREPFRPFAPAVPASRVGDLFAGAGDPDDNYMLRYMLMVAPWRKGIGDQVPAVNHLGTGRLQATRPDWNPLYGRVVEEFGQAVGLPVLLNTSFNLRGEPMAASPEDALRTFRAGGIDLLAIGPFLVDRG